MNLAPNVKNGAELKENHQLLATNGVFITSADAKDYSEKMEAVVKALLGA
ncbi:hypothetical protein [Pseudovibrio sp. Ad37]|nr:hypothetical protein [Pseudovibrio sp. Ad37]